MMNLLTKSSRILFKSLFSFPSRSLYFLSTSNSVDFDRLTSSFMKQPDMTIFSQLIRASNNTVDNLNYFKIFMFLEDNKSDVKHYQDFFLMIFATVSRRSDNLRMLLAKIKARIAKKYEQQSQYQQAVSHLQQGLQVLEQSLVPPIILYYQMYRYFGLIHYKLNRLKQTQQILKESVTTIQQCLQHSDDFVATSENSRMQAVAQTILAQLDTENADEWIKKAGKSWDEVETDNKVNTKEYCEYVLAKTKVLKRKDQEKAEQFLTVSIYNIKDPILKEHLKNKKKQLLN